MNNILPNAMNYLIVRNNDIPDYNTEKNHHLHGSSPTSKPVINNFTNRSVEIRNVLSSKVHISLSIHKFKYYVKFFFFCKIN